MKVNSITNFSKNYLQSRPLSFGDALSTKQEKEYQKLLEDIKKDQGYQDGISMVKIYAPALPSNKNEDTGIGKITSKEAERFYDFARTYYGANSIKLMPMGQLTDKTVYSQNGYPGAYNRSAFTVGEDAINLFDLAGDKYGNILSEEDAKKYSSEHKRVWGTSASGQNKIDFETTLGWKNQEDYPVNEALKTAFANFKNDKHPNKELRALRKEFESFKNQKEPVDYDDIYTRLALYPYMKDWPHSRVHFFEGFDSDPNIRAERMPEYNKLKAQYKDEIEFFKFKQFLSRKAVLDAKEMINSKGMDMVGDCIWGFSWPEEQMFPDAFMKDEWGRKGESGNWGLPAINFDNLVYTQNSPTHKLLKAKVAHHLTMYDALRFDVGWGYMRPSYHFGDHQYRHLDAGLNITNFIADIAREIKGNDFDTRKLMYECDADSNDFSLWDNAKRLQHLQGMAILTTEHEKNDDANIGWGNAAFLRETLHLGSDDFILGTNNHDGRGVLDCARDMQKAKEQAGGMMRTFKLQERDGVEDGWKFVKGKALDSEHFEKYSRARFAEIATTKNNFILYTDLLGRNEKVDYHTGGSEDYKNRLERKWEENYHKAVQDGVGYNAADVQKFRMEHDGTAHRRKDLYERAEKYAEYLRHKGGIYTREQADKSSHANLNIDSMSLEEIRNLNRIG